jgi:hypothetical protein
MTVLWSDNFTGTNGAAWNARWVKTGGTGSSTDIQSNAGRMRTGVTAFTTDVEARASGETPVVDYDITVKCAFDNPKKTEYCLAAVRCNTFTGTGFYPDTGYFLDIDLNNNSYTFRKGVAQAYTLMDTISKTFTAGTAIQIRLVAVGTAIKAKIWNDGSGEPASWDSEVTDSDVTAAGYVGLAGLPGVNSTCTFTWDDLTVNDGAAITSFRPRIIIT